MHQENAKFPCLEFARFLAAVHVVMYHFYGSWNFSKWGFTWVSFFFTLSGFICTLPRELLGLPLPTAKEMISRRVISIYPMLSWSLFLQLAVSWSSVSLSDVFVLSMVSLLVHSWWPHTVWNNWNNPSWFLCGLLLCWILCVPLQHQVRKIAARSRLLLLVCWTLSAIPTLCLTLVVPEQVGKLLPVHGNVNPSLFFFVSFNPVFYVHQFVSGIVLAHYYADVATHREPGTKERRPIEPQKLPFFFDVAASLSVLALLVLFAQPWADVEPLYFLWAHGVLLPLHASLILGLAVNRDPLCSVFRLRWLVYVGRYSFPMFLLQHVTSVALFKIFPGDDWFYRLYPIALALLSITSHYFVATLSKYFLSTSRA